MRENIDVVKQIFHQRIWKVQEKKDTILAIQNTISLFRFAEIQRGFNFEKIEYFSCLFPSMGITGYSYRYFIFLWLIIKLLFTMQDRKKTKRSHTLEDSSAPRFIHTLHNGFNYFHQLNLPQFKIRKNKNIRSLHTQSAIEDTPIYQTLQDNKLKLAHILTEVNQLREVQFNQYIKKSVRYQQLLDINDNKKKHLSTTNAKVGEVVKKSVQEAYPKNMIYNTHISTVKIDGWRPQARQGHSIVIYKDQAIMIGGHCSNPFSTITIFSLLSSTWIKTIQCEWARSYHSTILYKNRFAVVFGGMGHYNKSRKARDCYNSIFLVDLHNYGTRNLKMHNQQSIEPRRCHSATLLGRFMIIIGGINSKKQFLNDFVYLDLKQLRWYHKQYRAEGKDFEDYFSFGIAKHAAVSTFKPRKNYSFYSSQYQQTEAIFCFGGFNGNEDPNTVFHLVLNKFIPTFKKVDFVGMPPSPVSPMTQWYSQNSILIISGQPSERQIKLFKIRQKSFTGMNQYSLLPLGGVGSTFNKYNNQYFLFYGLSEEGYSGEIYKFTIEEIVKENENKKKKMLERNYLKETNYLSSETSSMISKPI